MLVRIGIAANRQGVSASTLRRWEKVVKSLDEFEDFQILLENIDAIVYHFT